MVFVGLDLFLPENELFVFYPQIHNILMGRGENSFYLVISFTHWCCALLQCV